MAEKNYALEWYKYGLQKNDEAVVKFMMHWIAFNWLYSEFKHSSNTRESDAITEYCKYEYEKLSRYDAFSTPEIDIFLDKPVCDIRRGRITEDGKSRFKTLRWGSGIDQLTSLLLTIYHVRCNLFHGSKSLREDRDIQLVRASSIILEGYLRAVLQTK